MNLDADKIDNKSLNDYYNNHNLNHSLNHSSTSMSNSNGFNKNLHKYLDICVDCYQIMDGIIISTSLQDLSGQQQTNVSLANNENSIKQNDLGGMFRKSSGKDLLKTVTMNNTNKLVNSNSNSNLNSEQNSSTATSPDVIMQSLSDVDIVNNINNTRSFSPLFTKTKMSNQSTPSSNTDNSKNNNNSLYKNDLSTIILNPLHLEAATSTFTTNTTDFSSSNSTANNNTEQYHSFCSSDSNNFKYLRERLTLDLKQAYASQKQQATP
jgi:hypothetical protein